MLGTFGIAANVPKDAPALIEAEPKVPITPVKRRSRHRLHGGANSRPNIRPSRSLDIRETSTVRLDRSTKIRRGGSHLRAALTGKAQGGI